MVADGGPQNPVKVTFTLGASEPNERGVSLSGAFWEWLWLAQHGSCAYPLTNDCTQTAGVSWSAVPWSRANQPTPKGRKRDLKRQPPLGASLVAQWLRIHLPLQRTRVQALVCEDPTCRGAATPVHHNYWDCTLEPASHNYWARVPQLLKPTHLEPVLRNKRSHREEKPTRRN